MKTKPFKLDQAREGHPVCTRDLRPARIVCDNMSDGISKDHILALVSETDGSETAYAYNRDGTFMGAGEQHRLDLQLASVKKTGWINIYKYPDRPFVETGRCTYESEEEANRHAVKDEEDAYIDTVQITWEDPHGSEY